MRYKWIREDGTFFKGGIRVEQEYLSMCTRLCVFCDKNSKKNKPLGI